MVKGASREKVGDGVAALAGDVQVRDCASGDSVGKDGPHPKREWGLQGYRVGIGTAESLCSGG